MSSSTCCCSTRRRYFEESQLDLIEARRQIVEVDERWRALRKDKFKSKNQFAREVLVSTKTFLEHVQENFEEVYEEGGFYELKTFCKLNSLKSNGSAELMMDNVRHSFPKDRQLGRARLGLSAFSTSTTPNVQRAD